jgi:hypothetical protein
VYYKDTLIAHIDPTPLKEPIKAKSRRKSKARAASEEQWIYMTLKPQLAYFFECKRLGYSSSGPLLTSIGIFL